MDQSHFFAYLFRMKLITRWPLMRNTMPENVQEHSHQVAIVAHCLGVINQQIFGGIARPEMLATAALFHDASEVITGDLPTPVKYFNDEISSAYKRIEQHAEQTLLNMLPEALQDTYSSLLSPNGQLTEQEHRLLKAADNLCAYIKTLEEEATGNSEFQHAQKRVMERLKDYSSQEVDYFLDHFIPSFHLSLDEISAI
ncbi:5'-deoxynucleotidase [Algicola sagamiensis]|uniref:5'-deoxynucleotidase n=1 Tax=Algicola sagamiensis TaxID=163869 RepID=UPI00037F9B35|nr:5'-deoxynucleotidase [Algicola sagamiensis]